MPKNQSKSESSVNMLDDSQPNSIATGKIESENYPRLNLFGTILTYAAPSSNHYGKNDEDNSRVLQTISDRGRDYPIISPYAIRDALRRILSEEKLPCNRSRIQSGGAPMVEFKEFPNPDKFVDDFFFGFCVTDRQAIAKYPNLLPKRDSIFRNNLAVGLSSEINIHLQQAPRNTDNSPWNNIKETALLYKPVVYTAYQYPFALSLSDCISQPEWTKTLIKAIGQLNKVAGGDSVSHYQMAPRSIIVRLTRSLVEGYDAYGFNEDGEFKELNRLLNADLPGDEFWLGGEIVRQLSETTRKKLENAQVKLRSNPQTLLNEVAEKFLVGG